uniref:I-set domain-containing protein n=1 Tax=Strongyloides papillosus TaxID=174720 RepID=A0A0N5BFU1_STREA
MLSRSYKPPYIIDKCNVSRHDSFPYIRLECTVISKFKPKYTWFDGEIELQKDGNFLIDCCDYGDNKYMCYLLIKKFIETYDTIYKCVVENKYGSCYAFYNIKKNNMFYPDIVPGKLIDIHKLNPRMLWKAWAGKNSFATYQWYWGDKKISEYGEIFKDIALKYGNTDIIESQLLIKDPKVIVPTKIVHCLFQNEYGNTTTSHTFFCLPPLNSIIVTNEVKIEAKKKSNNKIYVSIRIKFNSLSEPTIKWYNGYGFKYQNDEMHRITNIQEDGNGNYIGSLQFKEYTKITPLIICKIRNDKFDFLISIDAEVIEKKICEIK